MKPVFESVDSVLALVGTCVSFTFINPYSHQSNVMIMQPGGYTTGQILQVDGGWLMPG